MDIRGNRIQKIFHKITVSDNGQKINKYTERKFFRSSYDGTINWRLRLSNCIVLFIGSHSIRGINTVESFLDYSGELMPNRGSDLEFLPNHSPDYVKSP